MPLARIAGPQLADFHGPRPLINKPFRYIKLKKWVQQATSRAGAEYVYTPFLNDGSEALWEPHRLSRKWLGRLVAFSCVETGVLIDPVHVLHTE